MANITYLNCDFSKVHFDLIESVLSVKNRHIEIEQMQPPFDTIKLTVLNLDGSVHQFKSFKNINEFINKLSEL